jgi:hypothetical protein
MVSGLEGGKNIGLHAIETYCSKENKRTENNQILVGKLNISEQLVKGRQRIGGNIQGLNASGSQDQCFALIVSETYFYYKTSTFSHHYFEFLAGGENLHKIFCSVYIFLHFFD